MSLEVDVVAPRVSDESVEMGFEPKASCEGAVAVPGTASCAHHPMSMKVYAERPPDAAVICWRYSLTSSFYGALEISALLHRRASGQ